jgi:DNA-directed RNA polymerase sigma subunit (sigma70/sigma32)
MNLDSMKKQDRIDLGLALLKSSAHPGDTFSYDEIAAYCGCSANAVRDIEQKALAKLRRGLKRAGVESSSSK